MANTIVSVKHMESEVYKVEFLLLSFSVSFA